MSDNFRESLQTVDPVTGKRLWVYVDILSVGAWRNRRKIVAWVLVVFYIMLPWIKIHGLPFFQVDIANQRIYVFGSLFHADDLGLLVPFTIAGILLIFAVSAIAGRVWCGWACPQTVFLEFLYRPIEKWIEGRPSVRRQFDQGKLNWTKFHKKTHKFLIFGLISLLVANTFLGIFIGSDGLIQVMTHSPQENPSLFLLMVAVFAGFMFNFGWFREQMCTIACPYGRLQSVLLDRDSLIVGYDAKRGEPRGKGKGGDCVDCYRCVQVCPTGIDIRDGVQLECVACTACIDACNVVMKKTGKPENLISYTSERKLAGQKTIKRIRPRIYFALIGILVIVGIVQINRRSSIEVELLRHSNADFQLEGNIVVNHFQLMVQNRTLKPQTIQVHSVEADTVVVAPQNGTILAPDQRVQFEVFTKLSRENFLAGKAVRSLVFENESHEFSKITLTLFGPEK